MPVLHHYKGQLGVYAKAWIKGAIVTFQLTESGRGRLDEAGLGEGSKFPLSLLIDLIRRGEAFTHGEQSTQPVGRHEAEQFVFDFDQDLKDERILPVCEETGQIDDLHLVVHGDPPRAQLLSHLARRPLHHVAVSIPLALLGAKSLQLLAEAGKVPRDAPCLQVIRDWHCTNLAESWKAFTASQMSRQEGLGLRTPDEFDFD